MVIPDDQVKFRYEETPTGDLWYKIAAALMLKFNQRHVVLNMADLAALVGNNIMIQDLEDGIHLNIVDDLEAQRLVAPDPSVN